METDLREHYRQIRRVLIWILLLNWGVAAAKIFYGIHIHCSSMTADGFHSLSDGASNIIGLIGINIACRPSDVDHPYGHRKYETFFSLCIAGLLAIVSFQLIEGGIERFHNRIIPQIDAMSFIVMLVTLGINFLVMTYEYRKGKSLHSDILISDSMHTRADVLTSLSVIITMVMIKLGYPLLDPAVTIIIALFIARAAFRILKESSKVLCDTAVIIDVKRITDIVLGVEGVKACHKIRTRGRPDDIYIDLHVQVNPGMHIDKAHKISYLIEETIKKGIPEVSDVVVHMEPIEKG
ncbi:MAG: cation diffusion facilitator family transporter [Candidatus Omnitrophota bacterium]